MTPPQLTTDAPVFDVLQPVAVGVLELGGMEADGVVLDHLESLLSKTFHLEEPLGTELGFDNSVGTL